MHTSDALEDLMREADALVNAGRMGEAKPILETLVRLVPHNSFVLNALGIVCVSEEQLEMGLQFFQRVVQLEEGHLEAWNNLGVTWQRLARPERSIPAYMRALALNPGYVDAMVNLSFSLHQIGRHSDAQHAAERALALNATHAQAHWHRALALLAQGCYLEGFAAYEWRFEHPQFRRIGLKRQFSNGVSLWDGQVYPGLHLFLYAEQGIGDTLQMFRFVPLLLQHGLKITLECPDELRRLFSLTEGLALVRKGEEPPGGGGSAYDAHLSLMSLPFVLKLEPDSIPQNIPYLQVRPDWKASLALEGSRPFKVGLVWKGNSGHSDDLHRSVTLAHFAGLADLPGVELISLQKGASAEELEAFPGEIIDAPKHFKDFADTAALMSDLHLVIGVDTAVVHLAGALGIPAWVCLSVAVDWRWGAAGSVSPWYPGLRLFRQKILGDWSGVFAEISRELAHRSGSNPPA